LRSGSAWSWSLGTTVFTAYWLGNTGGHRGHCVLLVFVMHGLVFWSWSARIIAVRSVRIISIRVCIIVFGR
jgi:hypothetical protein